MAPLVSVIVPVYNVENYLTRCIDSILSQSFSDFELILIDDGSTDQSGAICDEYALKDHRIRVIHQENAKLSTARNVGIDAAEGEWIAVVDSDDWIHTDYLRILLSGALEDTDIVICSYERTSNSKEIDPPAYGVSFRSISLKDIYSNHFACTRAWGRIIRRSVIGDLRFLPGTEPVEDALFNECLFREDMAFRIADARLYYYFMRSDSTIHTNMGRPVLNATEIIVNYLNKIDDAGKRKRIIIRCYKNIFSARYHEMYAGDYTYIKKRCRKIFRQLALYLPELNVKDRLLMRILSVSPQLYRAFRILNDPSLIEYEKRKKRAHINT